MKTIYSTLILFLSLSFLNAQNASAQKYKVKGETITKDDVVLGTVTGKGGLLNANFIIYGLNGEKVVSVYRDEYRMENPLFNDLYWYNVRFEDTGKELFLPMAVEFSIKSVLNKTFMTAGIVIDGGAIRNQDEVIAKSDIRDSIINDTTYFGKTLRESRRLIKETPLMDRNMKAQVTFNYIGSEKRNDTTFTQWNIYQDGALIGTYLQRSKYLFSKDNYTYIIYRKVPGNNGIDVPIAFGEPDALNASLIKFYAIANDKETVINMTPGVNSQIVYALIVSRYF
ncbi:MAG: hypothetical protein H7282_08330 [Cytophagaceae bacterium]|nr:hypothetical protein [Cytophagaceae bacterium]